MMSLRGHWSSDSPWLNSGPCRTCGGWSRSRGGLIWSCRVWGEGRGPRWRCRRCTGLRPWSDSCTGLFWAACWGGRVSLCWLACWCCWCCWCCCCCWGGGWRRLGQRVWRGGRCWRVRFGPIRNRKGYNL